MELSDSRRSRALMEAIFKNQEEFAEGWAEAAWHR
jgi:hypothetical protein